MCNLRQIFLKWGVFTLNTIRKRDALFRTIFLLTLTIATESPVIRHKRYCEKRLAFPPLPRRKSCLSVNMYRELYVSKER